MGLGLSIPITSYILDFEKSTSVWTQKHPKDMIPLKRQPNPSLKPTKPWLEAPKWGRPSNFYMTHVYTIHITHRKGPK
jgi:hypothetical protein